MEEARWLGSVILEKNGHIAVIYLNHPESLNAFSQELKECLLVKLKEVEADPFIQIVILSGKGKSFCAGGDLKGMSKDYTAIELKQIMDQASSIVDKIRKMPKLFIAAVHGYAAGAGMSLALASDLIVAEKGSKFVLSFKNVGLIPDLGLLYHLPKKVGEWKAKEWIWKGATIPIEEAFDYGIVSEITPKGQVLDRSMELAEEFLQGAMQALIQSKIIINQSSNLSFDEVLQKENMTQTILRKTTDHKEGVMAFLEKRNPVFNGK